MGSSLSEVKLPGLGSITEIGGKWDSNEAFFGFQSFTVPPSIYSIDFKEGETSELWARVDAPSIDPSAYEVKQVWFSSKDGTKVPMFVFYKKGLVLNGKNPTVLTGYGGFNISLTPSFAGGSLSVAGAWRRFCRGQPARRGGVWRRVASGRHAGEKAECF